MTPRDPYPVLCDRCGAEGLAGEVEFERLAGLGDLLDFEPVPRRVARADGWTPEIQRAYVAALAVTGSERQACAVVQRAPWGVHQLRKAEGSESFVAASDKAMEIYQERERVRRADSLLAAARGEAARTRGRPRLAWSNAATRSAPPSPPNESPDDPPEDPDADEKEALLWLERMLRLYLIKLESERSARLEGHVAAADLYVRQATAIEVMMDLAAAGFGLNVLEMINNLSVEGTHFIHVAETPFSRLLDEARRRHWETCGEPARPEPPRHLFEPHHGVALEPGDEARSGRDLGLDEQWRAFKAQHERDAAALVEWEARARREAAEWRARVEAEARRDQERRRDSDAAPGRRDGEGRPACGSADRTDVTNSVRDGPGADGEGPTPEPPSGEEPAP